MVLALVGGCAQNDRGQKQTIGTVLGAATGALVGAQFGKGKGQLVGVAAGTLLGAFIGSEIGKSLDKADQEYMARTNQQALETNRSGTTSTWRNPDSGHSGTITPEPGYVNNDGLNCREYTQTITVEGRTETAVGTACRNPDGTWRIVQS
jgi:surface antigen